MKDLPVDQNLPLEHRFKCPNCIKETTTTLDINQPGEEVQTDEECEVCGNEIELRYMIKDGKLAFFEANDLEEE